jgi:hypothetical protein
MTGGKYTWSNKRKNPTLEKLDRILMSPEWEMLFPLVSVRKLVKDGSDHCPLLLDTGDNVIPRKKGFKFDLSWLKNKEFLPKVAEIWEKPVNSSDPIDVLNIKLKRFKMFFKGWGSNLFGHLKKKKLELRLELENLENMEESMDLSPVDWIRKTNIQAELFNLYAEEEEYWYQRSHSRWLLHGDQNTSYFHRIANGRKRKKTIHSLDNDGIVIEGTKNLLQHATDYYKNLFGPAPGNLFPISPNLWSAAETLTVDDNIDLTRPFSMEEVKNALFEMDVNRAPGPDEIPSEFYQHCWDIVKGDIMRLFEHFYEGTLDVQRLNYGIITLLPKVSEANKIQPISANLFA